MRRELSEATVRMRGALVKSREGSTENLEAARTVWAASRVAVPGHGANSAWDWAVKHATINLYLKRRERTTGSRFQRQSWSKYWLSCFLLGSLPRQFTSLWKQLRWGGDGGENEKPEDLRSSGESKGAKCEPGEVPFGAELLLLLWTGHAPRGGVPSKARRGFRGVPVGRDYFHTLDCRVYILIWRAH